MTLRWLSGKVGHPPGKEGTDGRTRWEEMNSHRPCAAVVVTDHSRLWHVTHTTAHANTRGLRSDITVHSGHPSMFVLGELPHPGILQVSPWPGIPVG